MDKDVVPWFQLRLKTDPFQTWKGFLGALELEFGPSSYACPRSSLFKLCQTNSVNQYYAEFAALANRVTRLTTYALLDCFLSGLKPDLHRDVLALGLESILKAISLARLFEEKYVKKPYHYFTPNHSKP